MKNRVLIYVKDGLVAEVEESGDIEVIVLDDDMDTSPEFCELEINTVFHDSDLTGEWFEKVSNTHGELIDLKSSGTLVAFEAHHEVRAYTYGKL